MLPPIPTLEDYGLSPKFGFLPDTLPLTRLPDPYYNKWETVIAILQAGVLSRRLRSVVDSLPVLSTAGLEHNAEWRRAYSLLCFIAHAYIWGGDTPADRLPPPVAVPLLEIAERLEMLPVATYAAVCLWNFKPLFLDEPIDSLENLATLNTFTGSIDESWFYLVSVAIEARGAPILPLVLKAISAVRRDESDTVADCLRAFAELLTDLTVILQRMHEHCDPAIFYHRIRPFLAGSKNMAEAGLPRGVLYDVGGTLSDDSYRKYSGGSNAQSSLIQLFDIALGIQHSPTGESRAVKTDRDSEQSQVGQRNNFIREMRQYMPGPHARFLEDVERVANIREYVESRSANRDLRLAYDACLAMLSAFRDKHIAIVTRYIISPSSEARARSDDATSRKHTNIATATAAAPERSHKGTGGTALLPFLKQARDETAEPAIEEWAKRFMRRKLDDVRSNAALERPEQTLSLDKENFGLKGQSPNWTKDEEVGGICLI